MAEIGLSVKTGKRRTLMSFFELFKLDNKTKNEYYSASQIQKGRKREKLGENDSEQNGGFRERTSDFSLEYRAIRPSEFFGTRRKVVLLGEAYVWAPVLGSFVKLREVGVSSYLGFTLCLTAI